MSEQKQSLRASATTRPQDLAGAIAKYITQDKQSVEVVAIGAGSLNQAIKGLIIARRFVASDGRDLTFTPYFRSLELKGKEVTAIVLEINE